MKCNVKFSTSLIIIGGSEAVNEVHFRRIVTGIIQTFLKFKGLRLCR